MAQGTPTLGLPGDVAETELGKFRHDGHGSNFRNFFRPLSQICLIVSFADVVASPWSHAYDDECDGLLRPVEKSGLTWLVPHRQP